MQSSLLSLADELERRDAVVAAELVRVEQLQAEVEEIRTHARALAEWLPWAAQAVGELEAEALSAGEEAARLTEQVRAAEDELELARLRTAIADAEQRRVRAQENARAVGAEIIVRQGERERLVERARVLTIRGIEPPGDLAEWSSQARGALLVERSALAREREAVVREASELLGSVLGDPFTATSVAGLRGRLERALT